MTMSCEVRCDVNGARRRGLSDTMISTAPAGVRANCGTSRLLGFRSRSAEWRHCRVNSRYEKNIVRRMIVGKNETGQQTGGISYGSDRASGAPIWGGDGRRRLALDSTHYTACARTGTNCLRPTSQPPTEWCWAGGISCVCARDERTVADVWPAAGPRVEHRRQRTNRRKCRRLLSWVACTVRGAGVREMAANTDDDEDDDDDKVGCTHAQFIYELTSIDAWSCRRIRYLYLWVPPGCCEKNGQ